jgi:hypothetical protein
MASADLLVVDFDSISPIDDYIPLRRLAVEVYLGVQSRDQFVGPNIDVDPAWLRRRRWQFHAISFIAHGWSSRGILVLSRRYVTFWWSPNVGPEALDVECPVLSGDLGVGSNVLALSLVMVIIVIARNLDEVIRHGQVL